MKVVIQRVSRASVSVDGECIGCIGMGYLILAGFGHEDNEEHLQVMANKIINLRIFPDENDKMNLSLLDVGGEILCVSQFTLYADCRKGRRPSFTDASTPDKGAELYERFVQILKDSPVKKVETGKFQAVMHVDLINQGPVTIVLNSNELVKN